jgi:hypothetical protein
VVVIGANQAGDLTSVNRVYLLTLRSPCSGLEFQQKIGVSSNANTISQPGGVETKCYIEEIRPVDYKAMRRTARAEGLELSSSLNHAALR